MRDSKEKVVPQAGQARKELHWRADRVFAESTPDVQEPITEIIEPAPWSSSFIEQVPPVLVCMPAETPAEPGARNVVFDTDGKTVGIDNRASVSMSPDREDFVGTLKKQRRIITGFGGPKTYDVYVGTIKWSIEDDTGTVHDLSLIHI